MPFVKGESGNKAGRPKADTTKLRESLIKAAPEVIANLIQQAKAGDPVAVKEFLARVLPTLKPEARTVQLALPDGTLMARAEAVLALAAAGDIPLDVASEYIGNATRLVAIEQGTELRAQLQMLLEDKFGGLA